MVKATGPGSRGAVLLLVLGVLAILALLGITFLTLQRTERILATSNADFVRARLLAFSGLEHALSQGQQLIDGSSYTAYGGNVTLQWPQTLASDPVRLEWAQKPSWFVPKPPILDPNAPNAQPWTFSLVNPCSSTAAPVQWGFSGVAALGPYGGNTAAYAIRAADASSLIYLNDGAGLFANPDSAGVCPLGIAHSTVSQNLKWVLNQLGWAAGLSTSVQVGCKIVDYRDQLPGGAVPSKEVLKEVLAAQEYAAIEPFVTTFGSVDKNVVDPVPLSTAVYPPSAANLSVPYPPAYRVIYNRGDGTNPRLRFGRGVNAWGQPIQMPLRWYGAPGTSPTYNATLGYQGAELFAMDELAPQYVEVVHRAPVYVNGAPVQVLEALIANVEGFFWIERRTGAPLSNAPATFNYTDNHLGYFMFTTPQRAPSLPTYTGHSWLYSTYNFAPGNSPDLDLGRTAVNTQGALAPLFQRRDYDELGFLYKTGRIRGTWDEAVPGVSAKQIADHIVACRTFAALDGINYAQQPFGGPFRTWAQFAAFLENLVAAGILRDYTNTFWDYNPSSEGAEGNKWLWSTGTHPVANQAMADALLANFNPNLHLNVLNPDRNMFRRVDKLSLVKHTTELSLHPGGVFEIESLGRVLEPLTPGANALAAGTVCQVRAEAKVVAAVRLFEKYRESTQRHFNLGALTVRQSNPETNNNTGLRSGPESINVPYPHWDMWNSYSVTLAPAQDGYAGYAPGAPPGTTGWGFEAEGYLALDTYGGSILPATIAKLPSAPIQTTPQLGLHLSSDLHAHFAFDSMLCYNSASIGTGLGNDARRELAGNDTLLTGGGDLHYKTSYIGVNNPKVTRFRNYAAPGEIKRPPYDPTKGSKHYRAYRSFRIPAGDSTAAAAAWGDLKSKMETCALNHLRADGMYSERHSGLAYWLTWGRNFDQRGGFVAGWVKPNWEPEWTGRSRNLFSMSRYHHRARGSRNPENMNLMFIPAHFARHVKAQAGVTEPYESLPVAYYGAPSTTNSDTPEELTGGYNVSLLRPMSLYFSSWYQCFIGSLDDSNIWGYWSEAHYGLNSRTLAHRGHAPTSDNCSPKPEQLEGRRWSFLGLQWYDANPGATTTFTNVHRTHAWTNQWYAGGAAQGAQGPTHFYAGNIRTSSGHGPYYHRSSMNPSGNFADPHLTNALRLGEVSQHGARIERTGPGLNSGQFRYPRNWPADCTFDEVYLWRTPSQYGPGSATPPSGMQSLFNRGRYYRPALNNPLDALFTSAPIYLAGVSSSRTLPPPASVTPPGGGSMAGVPAPAASGVRRLLGVAWTWHAEGYGTYANPAGLPTVKMRPYSVDYRQNAGGGGGGLTTNSQPCLLYQSFVNDPTDGEVLPKPIAQVRVTVGVTNYPPLSWFIDDRYSPTLDASGKPVAIPPGAPVQYSVWFQIDGLTPSSQLLLTPYFDDITLFVDRGRPEILQVQIIPAYAPPCP